MALKDFADRLRQLFTPASEVLSPDTKPLPVISPTPTPSGPFQLRQTFGWKNSAFNSVTWSPDGQHVAAASNDTCIYIWSTTTGDLEELLEGHQRSVLSVAWSPDSRLLASGAADNTVRVWEAQSGRALRTLEGHQRSVLSVAWSPDSRLLASGAAEGDGRLWSCETWQEVKRYKPLAPKYQLLTVGFTSVTETASTFGDEDIAVRAWNPEEIELSDVQAAPTSIHSTSVKIVFVGESNVGKSCLALRLAENRYEEQGSTLGMKLWTLPREKLDPQAIKPPGEKCDVTLWDLGGQDEYRLVHQLFLHDTTLALVLLDPTRGRTAFEEVEGWNLRLEKQLHGRKPIKLLVGTKLDADNSTVDQAGLRQLIETCGFDGYFSTSAKKPRGIEELRAAIAAALDWDNLAKTTRPVVFQQVRDAIEARRKADEVVLLYRDLEEQIRQANPDQFDLGDVDTVVKQLAVQGVVVDTRESSGQRVLVLRIEEIERYAGSLILTVRDNPRGVPALEEQDIVVGRLAFPGIKREERLHPVQERFVVESVVQFLLEYGICFRHEGTLIFPSLFPETVTREVIKMKPAHKSGGGSRARKVSAWYRAYGDQPQARFPRRTA